MAYRLGMVIFWVFLVATLLLALGAVGFVAAASRAAEPSLSGEWFMAMGTGICAIVSYWIGRAFRYVLAGH